MPKDKTTQLVYYERVLDILEKSRSIWPDAPLEGGGLIFSETFLRGVRHLWSETYMFVSSMEILSPPHYFIIENAQGLSHGIETKRLHNIPNLEVDGFCNQGDR
jgi:hypothetical protein